MMLCGLQAEKSASSLSYVDLQQQLAALAAQVKVSGSVLLLVQNSLNIYSCSLAAAVVYTKHCVLNLGFCKQLLMHLQVFSAESGEKTKRLADMENTLSSLHNKLQVSVLFVHMFICELLSILCKLTQ